jgi:hypothetical protein
MFGVSDAESFCKFLLRIIIRLRIAYIVAFVVEKQVIVALGELSCDLLCLRRS